MAEIDSISTPAASDHLARAAFDLCIDIGIFLDLVEQETRKINSTDISGIEFLVDAARTKMHRFGDLLYKVSNEPPRPSAESCGVAMELSGELSYIKDLVAVASEQADQLPNGKLVAVLDAAMPRIERARELSGMLEVAQVQESAK